MAANAASARYQHNKLVINLYKRNIDAQSVPNYIINLNNVIQFLPYFHAHYFKKIAQVKCLSYI